MTKKNNTLLIIIGIILAIIFGIFFPSIMNSLSFIGTIYINLLKFMIFPIIFTSIMTTIYKSKKFKNSYLIKTVFLFIIMFSLTFLLTSLIVTLLKPGNNYLFNNTIWSGSAIELNFTDILVNLFPNNIVTMIQNNYLFATIILSILCGYAAISAQNGDKVYIIIDGIKNMSYKILQYIMYLTPLAVFTLLGNAIASYGNIIFALGAKYILIAYFCSIIALILIMILPAWLIGKINPIIYVKKVSKVWLMSITTCSSVATLATTMQVCNEDLKIPSSITNITIPLGCTIHMCGGAVSFALLAIFCSQIYSIDITIGNYIIMFISALLINMAAPGIPNGGIVIGATYLQLLGIPLTFIGFYSGIYKLLDMAYTTLNVTGDITASIIINKYSK